MLRAGDEVFIRKTKGRSMWPEDKVVLGASPRVGKSLIFSRDDVIWVTAKVTKLVKLGSHMYMAHTDSESMYTIRVPRKEPPRPSRTIARLFKASAAALTLSACTLAPVTIHVEPDVAENHEYVKSQIRAGIDTWCNVYALDCAEWQHGLEVYVVNEPWPHVDRDTGKKTIRHGTYTRPPWDKIEMVWGEGVCADTLFHELLHRLRWFKKDPAWKEHEPWFYSEVKAVIVLWGCP